MTMKPIAQELLRPDEQVVLESKATKFSSWFISGGRLTLTDQRLIFLNRKGTSIVHSIDRSNIVSVGKGNSFTLIHFLALLVLFAPAVLLLFLIKAVRLTTSGGEVFRYQLPERKKWLTTLSAVALLLFISVPSHAQSIDGFRGLKFGMTPTTAEDILTANCVAVEPMFSVTAIIGNRCFTVAGARRDVIVHIRLGSDNKGDPDFRVAAVVLLMGDYSKKKVKQLDSALNSKYKRVTANKDQVIYANGHIIMERSTFRGRDIISVGYFDSLAAKGAMENAGMGQKPRSSDF